MQTQYTYEPYGKTTATGASNANPFEFTGRENEANGLYYFRARYYNPTFQRFISEDPLDFDGGDFNLYEYVGDSPVDQTDPSGMTAAPGFAESLIPIWGSGRQAIHDFECGNWAGGLVNTGLATSDVFLIKSVATTAGKVGIRGLANVSGSHPWDATRKWMTGGGWRDFSGQAFHHWAIPQNGWGAAVPDVIKNQPWNIMKMTAPEHTALHEMTGAPRVWNGTPTWAKVALADAAGKAGNLAVRSCGCE